jgi:hypothetical protein
VTLMLYVLVKMVTTMIVGAIAMFVILMTCCLAALPYIGSVILLPLTVFVRSYSLCFIEQFGPDWQFFAATGPEPPLNSANEFGTSTE